MAKNEEMLLIGGILLVGAFMFKDQICQAVPGIPLLCDSAGGHGVEDAVRACIKECSGNEGCVQKCSATLLGHESNAMYAGYY